MTWKCFVKVLINKRRDCSRILKGEKTRNSKKLKMKRYCNKY